MDDGATISATTVRRALVRAAGPLVVTAPLALSLLAVSPRGAATAACVGAALALAAAATRVVEALGASSPRRATIAAWLLGGALGGVLVLQLLLVDGALRGGSPAAGVAAVQGLGPGAVGAVLAGAVVLGAAVTAVVGHRLDLDPADRLAGTQGNRTRPIVRSVLLAAPVVALAPLAGAAVMVLLSACWLDERVHRALVARAATGADRLRERLARGELSRDRLELAAYAGDPTAREVVETPFVPDDLHAWAQGLRVFGPEACARAAIGGLAVAVPAHERAFAGDVTARAAWGALEAWARQPGTEALAEARAAADRVTPADVPAARAIGGAADAASRAGPFGAAQAARDAAASLVAAAEATGDAAVVRDAAAQALRVGALG